MLHIRNEGIQLASFAKHNPRKIWKRVRKKHNTRTPGEHNFCIDEFKTHFENVFSETVNQDGEQVQVDSTEQMRCEALDGRITCEEVIKAISKLKRNKSSGSDSLCGEIFIDVKDILAPTLVDIFNIIFDRGIYPSS